LIAALNLLTYGNSLSNNLVGFDDNPLVEGYTDEVSHRPLVNLGPIQHLFPYTLIPPLMPDDPGNRPDYWASFAEGMLFGRVLRLLSHTLDLALFGQDLWWHHLMSVAYHILAACAAFAAASMLLGGAWGGLAAALFFSLHPLQTESVAYLAGRRDILLGLFYLLGLCCWIKRRTLGALLCGLMAFGVKQTAVTFPIAVLAYEIFARFEGTGSRISLSLLLGRIREELFRYRGAVLAVVLCTAALGAFVISRESVNNRIASKNYGSSAPWYGDSAKSHWATVPKILARAIRLTAWPGGLSADYSYNAIPASRSFLELGTLASLAFLAGLAALAWLAAKRRPIVGFAFAWAALTYLPHLPLIASYHNRELFAEHWLYLPLFGPALLFGLLFVQGRTLLPRFSAAACAVVLAAFMIRGAQRNRDWKDDLALWARTVQDVPASARAHNNLGIAYTKRGFVDEALQEFEKAVEIEPSRALPYYNLGHLLMSVGQFDEAIKVFRRSIELSPRDAIGWDGLMIAYTVAGREKEANALAMEVRRRGVAQDVLFRDSRCTAIFSEGDYAQAEKCYEELVRSAPALATAHSNLGAVYLELGKLKEAEEETQASLRIEPDQPVIRANLAMVYGKMRKLGAAMRELNEAERLGYPRVKVLMRKGLIFRDCGLAAQSLRALQEVHRLAPTLDTFSHLGQTYAAMGDWGRAEGLFRIAIVMGPYPRDYYLLAKALKAQGKVPESVRALRQALELQPKYPPALGMLRSMGAKEG